MQSLRFNRVRRWVRLIAKSLIVALWAGLLISWIISYRVPHGFYFTGVRRYGLRFEQGFVQFRYGVKTDLDFANPGRWTIHEVGYSQPNKYGPPISWGSAGPHIQLAQWPPFQEAEFASGGEVPTIDGRVEFFGERIRIWGVPHWLAIAILTPVVAWIVYRAWRIRIADRIARGLCPRCGYDLRASPQRCPECGAVRAESPDRTVPAT
jgi:hypothetical protein